MKFEKAPQEVVELFASVVPDGAQQRKMFGYPAAFVNGNMIMGVFGSDIFVRLPEDDRAKLMKSGGTSFEPMGRPMREYVVVPQDRRKLGTWAGKALEYGRTLPAKKPKKK